MTVIVLNGKSYNLPTDMTENNGAGHRTPTEAGTGETLPRFFAAMVDAIADATKHMVATSSSSVTVGTGTKSFVLSVDLPWFAGLTGIAVDNDNPTTNRLFFTATDYDHDTKTLTVSVPSNGAEGSGTITDWTLTVTGQQGATGPSYDISASSVITALADAYYLAISDGVGIAHNKIITITNFLATICDPMNLQDNLLIRPEIKDYAETKQDVTAASTTTIDLESGNVINLAHGTTISTLNINNPPASGKAGSFTLIRKKDNSGTSRTIAWPASVKWAAATAPTLSQTANAVDIFTFITIDGGTTWYGFASGLAMA